MHFSTPDWKNLRNGEHFGLHREFRDLVEESGAEALGLGELFSEYLPIYEQEKNAQGQIRKSAFSAQVARADAARDQTIRGLRIIIRGLTLHYRKETRRAAQRLQIAFDSQGNVTRKAYDSETAFITALLGNLQTDLAADVDRLNLTDWVQELQRQNEALQDWMARRYTEQAQRLRVPLRQVRRTMDQLFIRIRERIQAELVLQPQGLPADFTREWNARVESSQQELAKRRGRSARKRKAQQD